MFRGNQLLDEISNHITTSYKLTKKRSYFLLYTNFTIDLQDITSSKAFRQCVQEGPHAKQDEVLEIYRNEDVDAITKCAPSEHKIQMLIGGIYTSYMTKKNTTRMLDP